MPKSDDNDEPLLRGSGETRLADILTVCWMITVMQVLLFEVATVGFRWYFHAHPDNKQIGGLADVLYLCAALGGCVSLLLFPLVWKVRRIKPPLPITVVAVAIAILPIALLIGGVGLDR
jgi:hypothetical protein